MDGKQSGYVLIRLQMPILGFQQNGYHTGLPVMAMKNIRYEAEMGYGFQHSPAEKGKAFRFIVIPIKSLALKIILIINQIISNPVVFGFFNAAELIFPADPDIYGFLMAQPLL